MKNKALLLAPLAALAMVASPVAASTAMARAAPSEEASAPFINHGAIRDWRADGDREIYFQDSGRQWYRATLMTPAFDLPFVEAVGIQNSGTDRLDRWADVVVRGQHYPIQSFVKVDAPPVKSANAAHKS
ncbi:hypothetical protein F1640_04565 [Novosphingobium sp. NBM11]|uniref:DUF6491 family protein n=1 Tax=Novosphingobium sp. NBM11 TaxID=2596914 RepID=UPI0018924F7A|nr:DUF6491 family protein [Novosphingobium sp. NBM11]MBF5089297.1 hypothetical protein [Novosphingobium sp. NBM11]